VTEKAPASRITFKDVHKTFAGAAGGRVQALDGVGFEVAPGETLCLIGTSGCGKTTTLRLVNRLEVATSGWVWVGGRLVLDWDPIELRRSIGYVAQGGCLFPHLTVFENITLLQDVMGESQAAQRHRAHELLELVGLDPVEVGARWPRQLSGGQQQRVSIARALVLDPPLMLMDEPFGALDPVTRTALNQEFLRVRDHVRKTTVIVTHDLREAFLLGHRVALMAEGKVVQIGTEDDLVNRPASEFVREFLRGHSGVGHA